MRSRSRSRVGVCVPVDDPPSGYRTAIITNHYVIDACTYTDGPPASVSQGGEPFGTELWSWDVENDLALLFVDRGLPEPEEAPPPEVGDEVVAIGSPYGLEHTVTRGIVSKVLEAG